MTAADPEFLRAFAARVRATVATIPEGSPTVNDTTTSTTETIGAPAVPATFQAEPDAPCERNAWCKLTGTHADCYGPEIGLPTDNGSEPGVLVGQLHYDSDDDATVLIYQLYADWIRIGADQLRAETARVRAHLARLDALADQYDAILEADSQPPAPAPAGEPHTWSFTDWNTGKPVQVTCMVGCTIDHSTEAGHAFDPADVQCVYERTSGDDELWVPVARASGEPVRQAVLNLQVDVHPYSSTPGERMPVASVELVNDHWIADMDPDTFESVIGKLQARVDAMRSALPVLRAARAEYEGRTR